MEDQPVKLQRPPGYKDPTEYSNPNPKGPPRKAAALPPSFQPRKKLRRGGCCACCRVCCCCCCIITLIIFLLLVICAGLFYLWFDPKLPVFRLASFKFSALDVSSKPDGSYLTAAALARVEVRNPNQRLTYQYGVSDVELTAGNGQETALGTTRLPGFEQGRKNTTSLKIKSSVKEELIADGLAATLLDQLSSKNLVVNVAVKTSVGIGMAGGLKIGKVDVRVLCAGVTLKQIDGGQMPGCVINMLKWVNLKS